jgi:transcriptional regulator with XRE-family HTH domain
MCLNGGSGPTPRVSERCGSKEEAMKGHEFKRWRKSLNFNQKEAADALGLKRRVVQYYEKGERSGGKPVKIPRTVRLACYAIMTGVTDYHGQEKDKDKKPEKAKAAEAAKPEKKKKKDKEKDKER